MGKKGWNGTRWEDNAQVKQGCYCYGSNYHRTVWSLPASCLCLCMSLLRHFSLVMKACPTIYLALYFVCKLPLLPLHELCLIRHCSLVMKACSTIAPYFICNLPFLIQNMWYFTAHSGMSHIDKVSSVCLYSWSAACKTVHSLVTYHYGDCSLSSVPSSKLLYTHRDSASHLCSPPVRPDCGHLCNQMWNQKLPAN